MLGGEIPKGQDPEIRDSGEARQIRYAAIDLAVDLTERGDEAVGVDLALLGSERGRDAEANAGDFLAEVGSF
ncbi:MAG: hypothetical protein WD342_07510 [Verrucomicrobiales bacterium]